MIIGAADQNSGLFHADFLYQFEIFRTGADPAGNLRELISPLHTFINRIPVFLTVQEKFAGTNHTVRPAQSVQIIIDRYNLFCGIRRSGLLPVPESRISNPDILRHIMGHNSIVTGRFAKVFASSIKVIPPHLPVFSRRFC